MNVGIASIHSQFLETWPSAFSSKCRFFRGWKIHALGSMGKCHGNFSFRHGQVALLAVFANSPSILRKAEPRGFALPRFDECPIFVRILTECLRIGRILPALPQRSILVFAERTPRILRTGQADPAVRGFSKVPNMY